MALSVRTFPNVALPGDAFQRVAAGFSSRRERVFEGSVMASMRWNERAQGVPGHRLQGLGHEPFPVVRMKLIARFGGIMLRFQPVRPMLPSMRSVWWRPRSPR